ncbi:Reverse transcriptase (RNA-dependent DNA polymerase) [Rhizobium leguminosarum bv. viciae WSM1455]|nr:Reverse transcriptase (RNA-dependent DNA polymerase) [Rhizobium leguminosarum bv. viciae WSM1455]
MSISTGIYRATSWHALQMIRKKSQRILSSLYCCSTKNGQNSEKITKVRPIRYASRKDAAIFARYRTKLAKLYEKELERRGIADVPVAYRRLPKVGGGNKCNIEIARDVFSFIKQCGDCCVTVVDIKSYFESLDHQRIKDTWQMLIGATLPADHLAVFKAVTRYSVVDIDLLFSRLRMHETGSGSNRVEKRKRKIDILRTNGFKQICEPADFRNIVAGKGQGHPSLIQKNGFDFGIPQGTPLSDLIANFYLIDFDEEMNSWAQAHGGLYRRYSDDIVVVVPRDALLDPMAAKQRLQAEIKKYGKQLKIQDKKVAVCNFSTSGSGLSFTHLYGKASKNGLEYLGFEFDGQTVKIKNSTLSNAWRKLKRRAYGDAWRFVKRYRAKGKAWLILNYDQQRLETKLLRNVTFNQDMGYETWTFSKYVGRASKAFIGYNPVFSTQTQRYRRHAKFVVAKSFSKALRRHLK